MGCQITSGDFSINSSQASWMVAHMCKKWFDKERDTDSDGHYQDSVDNTSIKTADAEWPHDVESIYAKYLAENPNVNSIDAFFKDGLMEARQFIADVAKTDRSASLSH